MNARKIHGYVAGKIQKIQALPEHPNKAMLANLRRGIGRAPGDIPALWGVFLQDLPPELQSDRGKASPAEWAIYTALTLYALHQQSQSSSMHRPGAGLGRAVRKLTAPEKSPEEMGYFGRKLATSEKPPEESSVFRRFNALATASSAEELAHHLRGIVQLLRREGIPLDYAQLAEDLYWMQLPATAPRVRLRWAEEYYHTPSEDNENTNTDSGKELQDE